MSWSTDGYTPDNFTTIQESYYNAFVSVYGYVSQSRFNASRDYQAFYSSAQVDMYYQTQFAQIFDNVATYLKNTDINIQTPSTVPTRIVETIKNQLGFDAACEEMTLSTAGILRLAIDYEPNALTNLLIVELLATEFVVGGVYTEGDISEQYTISNGQTFTWAWTNGVEVPIMFRLKIQRSRNASSPYEYDPIIQAKFLNNFDEIYSIGLDIEPEKYLEIVRDLPWAAEIVTEYSLDDGSTWSDEVIKADYNSKYVASLEVADIEVYD